MEDKSLKVPLKKSITPKAPQKGVGSEGASMQPKVAPETGSKTKPARPSR